MTGMTTTLADTSIWIDGLRHTTSWLSDSLQKSETIAYTEPIAMELLMGARDENEWERLRRFISGGTLVPFDSAADFEAAAMICYVGRRRGLSTGKVDCLILAVARRTGTAFVTRDQRQAELARLIGITLL